MIRPAQARDASRIAEILVFGKRAAYRDFFRDDRASFADMQVLPLAQAYLANEALLKGVRVYDDGIVKGLLRAEAREEGVEICELYTDPFFTGQGVGARLMRAFLLEYANAPANLWVIEQNARALRFYARFGFAPDGRRRLVEGTRVWEIGCARRV